jgi:hypothetical protein
MESNELDVLALVPEEVHHHLKIRLVRDIAGHDVEVRPVDENLAEELERLAFRDTVVR